MITENRKDLWNDHYRTCVYSADRYDDWISRHTSTFPDSARILELGCGFGHVSELLHRKGFKVVATDIAPAALQSINQRNPDLQTALVDIEQPLPYCPESFEIVVANLCLHYFDLATTTRIIKEIERILTGNGRLLARVNSSEDSHYGAGTGHEVERGFYEHNGHYKRFFDRQMIAECFRHWTIESIDAYELTHLEKPKRVMEVIVQKNHSKYEEKTERVTA